jgi:hypothetical protein
MLACPRPFYCYVDGDYIAHSPAIGGPGVNPALPTAFVHALESWTGSVFWLLGGGSEVIENTEKQQGQGA